MRLGKLAVLAIGLASMAGAEEAEDAARRFTLAYVAYAPSSSVDLRVDARRETPLGSYMVATALRTSLRGKEPEQVSLLVDLQARQVVAGALLPLPPTNPPLDSAKLPGFVERTLPGMLSGYMGSQVRIRWPSVPTRSTAVTALTVEIFSGYGWIKVPAAITMDGAYLMVGSSWPLDRDPRAVRRDILRDAPVRWDPQHESAPVKLVEFSDFQCPACKHSWTTVRDVLGKLGGGVRHGMVNYPLTNNHPWAFAAAVAGECIGRSWPDRFLALKEEFYRLQDGMSVETVKDAAFGFLAQQSLPEKAFKDCFMQDAVVDLVLRQIELAQRMGVVGTPTYFANGEIVSAANQEWMLKRLQAIAAAKGIPENAADIRVDPTPPPALASPSPAGSAPAAGSRPVPKPRLRAKG